MSTTLQKIKGVSNHPEDAKDLQTLVFCGGGEIGRAVSLSIRDRNNGNAYSSIVLNEKATVELVAQLSAFLAKDYSHLEAK